MHESQTFILDLESTHLGLSEKIAKQRYVQNVWDSVVWRDMAVLILLLVVVFGYFDLVVESLPVLEPGTHHPLS